MKEIPKVIPAARDICHELMRNRMEFDNCLEYLVCPRCANDLKKEAVGATGTQAEHYSLKCTKCEFIW
jgi:hypothetical protein